jgi:hypothetical protein
MTSRPTVKDRYNGVFQVALDGKAKRILGNGERGVSMARMQPRG